MTTVTIEQIKLLIKKDAIKCPKCYVVLKKMTQANGRLNRKRNTAKEIV